MNSFVKASLIAAMMTAPLMADESFGGVGITIYQVGEGVHVAEVIPGTPAAETNLRAGDIITSVDGVSLKGQDIEFSKSKLRGQVNKPLEITYTSNGETYSAVIRRAQITVKDLDNKAVKNWHTVIKFVVPQRDGIIAHRLHHIHDILSTGKSPRIAPLQIVPATDDGGPGRIAGRNGIIKARQPRITVNGTMHVIIRQDDDALFRPGVREILTLATYRH